MWDKVFLYCNETAGKEVVSKFVQKKYQPIALTDDPSTGFWPGVGAVAPNGTLVIYSHGNENGPLMVRGHEGEDMTDSQILTLGAILVLADITLYLLSCHTGQDPFAAKLRKHGVRFMAPAGYAAVGASGESLAIKSVASLDGKGTAPWSGNELKEPRKGSMLYLP